MTDDQIIQAVLDKINEWDNDTRNSPMFITNYIEEVYNLKERKSFEIATRMVKANLVERIRDNEYIMTDIGRHIADKPDGWLGFNKKISPQRTLPQIFSNKKGTTTFAENHPNKNNIPSWIIWLKEKKSELSIGIIIVIISLILEYKSGFFIKSDTESQSPTDTLSRRTVLKDRPVQQK
jgi:hypothetical protein